MSLVLDLSIIPFTCFGSYLAFSMLEEGDRPKGLYLRTIRGPALGGRPIQEIFRIELFYGSNSLPFTIHATPTLLRLESTLGKVDICFASASLICIRTYGVTVRFSMDVIGEYDFIFPRSKSKWEVVVNTVSETKLLFSEIEGSIEANSIWNEEHSDSISIDLVPGETSQAGEFTILEFLSEPVFPQNGSSFEENFLHIQKDFESWTNQLPNSESMSEDLKNLASYILWSCFVAPSGNLPRNSLYASKNGMIGLWSWDHAFFTRAFYKSFPRLAWDQFMAPFDFQDEFGAIPDFVNDRYVSWSFCKPPIHGWVLNSLSQDKDFLDRAKLKDIFEPLSMWTNWWLTFRDDQRDGMPQYHHGNDSGWDNSTVFNYQPPIKSPDLAAFLVLQMEFLAFAAKELGFNEKAHEWLEKSRQLSMRIIPYYWRSDHFVALDFMNNEIESQSLQLYLPLILGKRLTDNVIQKSVSCLIQETGYLTDYGLATENIYSPYYKSKGYWRGPIWPAATYIMYEALRVCGFEKYSSEIRAKFLNLIAHSEFAENFDALTGEGYHDFHFSWTASIYFLLLTEKKLI